MHYNICEKIGKRMISLLCIAAMLVTMFPMVAMAGGTDYSDSAERLPIYVENANHESVLKKIYTLDEIKAICGTDIVYFSSVDSMKVPVLTAVKGVKVDEFISKIATDLGIDKSEIKEAYMNMTDGDSAGAIYDSSKTMEKEYFFPGLFKYDQVTQDNYNAQEIISQGAIEVEPMLALESFQDRITYIKNQSGKTDIEDIKAYMVSKMDRFATFRYCLGQTENNIIKKDITTSEYKKWLYKMTITLKNAPTEEAAKLEKPTFTITQSQDGNTIYAKINNTSENSILYYSINSGDNRDDFRGYIPQTEYKGRLEFLRQDLNKYENKQIHIKAKCSNIGNADSSTNEVIISNITYAVEGTPLIEKGSLIAAISAANTNKGTAVVSTDGKDVSTGNKWVTSAVMTAYAGAIAAAQAVVDNADATQTDVDDAVIALGTATTTFNNEKAAGTKVDTVKTALTSAISAANINIGTVVVSTNGKDVLPTSKWVTSAVKTAYVGAIAVAQAVVDDANATQTDVDEAVIALGTATTTFNNEKAAGTKAEETPLINSYDDLASAVAAAKDGDTLTLEKAFEWTGTLDITGKNVTVVNGTDSPLTILNGFTRSSTTPSITGSGTIIFAKDIHFKGKEDIYGFCGLGVQGGANVTVHGNIEGAGSSQLTDVGTGLFVINSTVAVEGNVMGGTRDNVKLSGGSGGTALDADNSTVTVTGNVIGGYTKSLGDSGPNSSRESGGVGIMAKNVSVIHVQGDVSGGEAYITSDSQNNNTTGGMGARIDSSKLYITGNLKGGNGNYGGSAAYGGSVQGTESVLEVAGNVIGGSCSTDPGAVGIVFTSRLLTIKVGGDVIGGDSNYSYGGAGLKSTSTSKNVTQSIRIHGNVFSGDDKLLYSSSNENYGTFLKTGSTGKLEIQIDGNVTGKGVGISLNGKGNIQVGGDVIASGGNGIETSVGTITVSGNVTGAKTGVSAIAKAANAAVTINGNITGTAEYGALAAQTGAYTSTVTCDGTITGGISAFADDVAVKTLLGESYTVGTYINNKTVVKTELTNAISAAKTNKETVTVSADGKDVSTVSKWVTSAVMTAYTDAISAAQTVVDNTKATQTDVDDAVTALGAATITFDNAKANGIKAVVKTDLINAISAANTNKGTAVVSTDGKDVSTASKWITSAVMTAYTDAISAAQTVVDNTKATQTDVDDAVTALGAATITFDKAKAAGTKTSSGGSSNNGGGSGKGSSGGSSSTPTTTTTTTAKVDKKADSTGAATVKASEMKSADTLKVSGNSSADNATLQFDNKAVGAIVAAAGTGDIKISAEKIEKTALTSEQKEKIESLTKSNASQDQPIYSFKVTVGDKKVTDFKSGKVSIEVDYKPTKGTDNLIVFHIKDNGEVDVIKDCKYDAKTGKLTFSASGFSYFMVGNADDLKASFADVAKGAWYYDSVSYLLDKNLIKGKTETTFAPEANITRAEFVQILYNMSKNNQGANTEGVNFQDVSAGAWYYDAVAWGSKAGVVTGANNQFRPEDKISRQEMAVILDRYTSNVAKVTLNKTAEKISFKDSAAIGTWANAAVTTMQQTGIINGIADNGAYKFAPKENATRAQAAKMIAALVKQI